MTPSKPDYKFKLPEHGGLVTIEDIIRMKVEGEFSDVEHAMADVYDTRDGRYNQQYSRVGKMSIATIIAKFW